MKKQQQTNNKKNKRTKSTSCLVHVYLECDNFCVFPFLLVSGSCFDWFSLASFYLFYYILQNIYMLTCPDWNFLSVSSILCHQESLPRVTKGTNKIDVYHGVSAITKPISCHNLYHIVTDWQKRSDKFQLLKHHFKLL